MVLELLAEDESLDRVVVSQESHHILEEKPLTVGKELLGRIDLAK